MKKIEESSHLNDEAVSGNVDAPAPVRRPRGFAAIDRARVKETAALGGKAAHAAGVAHQFTSDEARSAGKKGGAAPHVRRGRGRGPRTAEVAK